METNFINGENVTLEEVINKNNGLIWSAVKRFEGMGAESGLTRDDLFNIAAIGMIKAFNRFNYDKYKVKFSTYALPLMFGEIRFFIRDKTDIIKFPKRSRELAASISKHDMGYENRNEVARHFGVTVKEVDSAIAYLTGRRTESLNKIAIDDEANSELGDQFGNTSLFDETAVYVEEWLNTLGPTDRKIFKLMLEDKTQVEIGRAIGLSQNTVSKRIAKQHKHIERFFGYPEGYLSSKKTKKKRRG